MTVSPTFNTTITVSYGKSASNDIWVTGVLPNFSVVRNWLVACGHSVQPSDVELTR